MNEHQRNEVIASHEDDRLNNHLDGLDDDACEVCEFDKATIEWGGQYICQGCYENACEAAEARCDDER